ASAIHIFVVSGFYIIYLPKLIKLHSSKSDSFRKELLTFGAITFASSVILVFIIPLISPFIFEIIGKSEFSSQTSLLYFLLFGFMLNNLSLIPHMYLYIIEDEKYITLIMAVSFLINLILNLVFIPKFGIQGAAYSLVCTYFIVLLLKLIRAKQKWKRSVVC
ncbi:MAG: polysaccharide biosynthesis C-terminal domain-containing protein, partial [Bacteroidota bacterium]